jgi:hypothetical protein
VTGEDDPDRTPGAGRGRPPESNRDPDPEPGTGPDPGDPHRVETLAVTTDDAVTALEARLRSGTDVVLRATPPFHARMRARLHRRDAGPSGEDASGPRRGSGGGSGDGAGAAGADPPAAVVADPRELFVDVPPFPTPDGTAADFDPGEAFGDRHRERHVAAVEDWRASVRGARADRASVETPAGTGEVRLAWLG